MTVAYKARPISKSAIAEYTRNLRRVCGYEFINMFPIIQFLELILPRLFPDFNLEIVAVDKMPFKEGETIPGTNTIRLREDVYLNACEGKGRARFTVGHEIGHFIFQPPDSITLCRMEEGQKLRSFEDPEWQANCFASELLAPIYLAKGLTKQQIMDEFRISESAAKVVVSKCKQS